jgi:hypothetical protein
MVISYEGGAQGQDLFADREPRDIETASGALDRFVAQQQAFAGWSTANVTLIAEIDGMIGRIEHCRRYAGSIIARIFAAR